MAVTPFPTPAAADSSASDGRADALTLEEGVILNRVTQDAWQVCVSRHRPHSPGYLLGFIENTSHGVELMQLGDHFIWTGFPTVQQALQHVIDTAYATATQRAAGDLAWIS